MVRPPLTWSANHAPPQARHLLTGPSPALRAVAVGIFWGASLLGAQEKPSDYAGSETCQACHEDIFKAFQKNAHKVVDTDKRRGWQTRACEACHGPGAKHAESVDAATIRNPAKLKPAETDRTCLTCHRNQPTHAGRIRSGHARNQVACSSCHSVHQAAEPRAAAAVNERCAACHAGVWAQFQRPHKHKLPEGAMSCVDCHNPHGSFLVKSLQAVSANEPGCFKCHGDKRGPFTFEHAVVRLEGCAACHEPHGSANPRRLVRAEIRELCLACHANVGPPPASSPSGSLGGIPPAFHDLISPRYRNCTLCHVKIHGSHVSRALLR